MKLERSYAQRLRGIARHIGDIVKGFAWETLEEIAASSEPAQRLLRRYADTLDPWANAVAQRMVAEVAASDRVSWRKLSSDMGRQLHREIDTAPTGEAMRASMQRQVGLIKSLPLDAAERVHKLTQEGITQGRRAAEIADEIMASGDVARSRAMLIARTEVSRTATELTKARAEHIGSTHFIWRTAGDSDVRSTHKVLNGKTFRWDQPPECDPGHHALPGGIWNCRCYPEVVVPDLD
ncbi:phage head morphogenesis protein [Methylobacterium sp. P1-11]|nr:phage head morphogenesis protein [Methylobacterium sp. P1-11]